MIQTDITRDLMRRTMANLRYVEAHQNRNGPYEVTQLVNSFLGALAHPWERYYKDLERMSINDAAARGWPVIDRSQESDWTPRSLGQMLRWIRNSFAHGHIRFFPDSNGDIGEVEFWNEYEKRRTWGTRLKVEELRQFLDCFVELAEEMDNQRGVNS